MKTPLHLWIVGILSLVWNAYGCYVYYLAVTANPEYLSSLTEAQRAAYEAMPGFYYALFAIAVWSALAGSLLLLLRMKLAVPVFMISLASMALSYLYAFFIADVSAPMSTAQIILTIAVVAVAVFLLGYARALAKGGALK